MDKPPKEDWSWEKLGDSAGAKAAAVVVIAIAVLWAYASWDKPTAEMSSESRDAPLQVVTSLQGVQLGQKLAAVASTHGPLDKLAERDVVRKYANEEDYLQRNGTLRVGVRDGVVRSIGYLCKEGRDRTTVNKVACHDLKDKVEKVFGDRVRVLCPKAKPENKEIAPYVRAYDAIEFGTRYVVIRDKVQGFTVTDPGELASLVGFNWVKCG